MSRCCCSPASPSYPERVIAVAACPPSDTDPCVVAFGFTFACRSSANHTSRKVKVRAVKVQRWFSLSLSLSLSLLMRVLLPCFCRVGTIEDTVSRCHCVCCFVVHVTSTHCQLLLPHFLRCVVALLHRLIVALAMSPSTNRRFRLIVVRRSFIVAALPLRVVVASLLRCFVASFGWLVGGVTASTGGH